MQIFNKQYTSEELCDLSRDIHECFDERFNPLVSSIPMDPDCPCFTLGTFRVNITWEDDKEE